MKIKTAFLCFMICLLCGCSDSSVNPEAAEESGYISDEAAGENNISAADTADVKTGSVLPEAPIIFSSCLFDSGYPEFESRSLILEMTEGSYDSEQENYAGSWSGKFRFRLTKSDMDTNYMPLDGDIISCSPDLSFNEKFELTVKDYNNDGYPDFTVNQWNSLSGGTDCYFFTVKNDGTVKNMTVKTEESEADTLWLPKEYRGICSPGFTKESGNSFEFSFYTSGGVTGADIPLIRDSVIDEWFAEHQSPVSEFTVKNVYVWDDEAITLTEQQILEADGSVWYTSTSDHDEYFDGGADGDDTVSRQDEISEEENTDIEAAPETEVKISGDNNTNDDEENQETNRDSNAASIPELIEEFNDWHGHNIPAEDYALYDIDGDNKEELLILSYGVILYGCGELHVYRVTDNGFKYCGHIDTLLQCEMNDNINDRGTDFEGYEKLDIKQFHYTDDFTYNCVFASSVRTAFYQNNYISAIVFDNDDMIKAIPIMMWGVDVSFDHLGMVLTKHSYFYGNGYKEEIPEEDIPKYMAYMS